MFYWIFLRRGQKFEGVTWWWMTKSLWSFSEFQGSPFGVLLGIKYPYMVWFGQNWQKNKQKSHNEVLQKMRLFDGFLNNMMYGYLVLIKREILRSDYSAEHICPNVHLHFRSLKLKKRNLLQIKHPGYKRGKHPSRWRSEHTKCPSTLFKYIPRDTTFHMHIEL